MTNCSAIYGSKSDFATFNAGGKSNIISATEKKIKIKFTFSGIINVPLLIQMEKNGALSGSSLDRKFKALKELGPGVLNHTTVTVDHMVTMALAIMVMVPMAMVPMVMVQIGDPTEWPLSAAGFHFNTKDKPFIIVLVLVMLDLGAT